MIFKRSTSSAFFLSLKGKRLSARAIDQIIRRIGADMHVEHSAHVLCYTCMSNLVRRGTDMVLVAKIAGHKWLETTRRSNLHFVEDREAVMEKLQIDY